MVSLALSGRYVQWGELPVAGVYPTNVFTLLNRSYEIFADESVTRLCPSSICGERPVKASPSSLWNDIGVVVTRALLPRGLADALGPPMNDRWAGFAEFEQLDDGEIVEGTAEEHRDRVGKDVQSDQRARFDRFIEHLGPSPAFYYLHAIVPHLPIRYVPGGVTYGNPGPLRWALQSNDLWTSDEDQMDLVLQRLILHAQYADEQIGRVLNRIDEVGILEESLLIVMSDRGQSLIPGTRRKARNDLSLHDALPYHCS